MLTIMVALSIIELVIERQRMYVQCHGDLEL